MRNRTLIALAVAATVAIAACSGSSLTGKTWKLTELTHRIAAGMGPVPESDQAKYTIEFMSDGNYRANADCNQTSGTYTTTSDGGLTIRPGPSTLVACSPSSFSDQYIQGLTEASSYVIREGELTLALDNGWSAIFK